ncbi:MAG: tetratricopeptide repeat protein, partial [Firmicutes bacterium]|nr:tetratricopeptide repeat protein [Bacillota bacterium]
MKCPNCGSETKENKKCPGCGVEPNLYIYTTSLSIKLYNIGLEEARRGNLSAAQKSLEDSILYNKGNIQARNLLGLVYYETGHIADAVRQWIISDNIQKEENAAHEYLDYFKNNIREFEILNDSVKLYNAAIKYVKDKNDDIAVIRLKKAIDNNPKFVDAYNLLALCYILQRDYEKAAELVSNVLSIDKNNMTALAYMREIGIDKVRNSTSSRKAAPIKKNVIKPVIDLNSTKSQRIRNAIMFAAGCLCAAVVMFVLIIPGAIEDYSQQLKESKKQYALLQQDYSSLKSYIGDDKIVG